MESKNFKEWGFSGLVKYCFKAKVAQSMGRYPIQIMVLCWFSNWQGYVFTKGMILTCQNFEYFLSHLHRSSCICLCGKTGNVPNVILSQTSVCLPSFLTCPLLHITQDGQLERLPHRIRQCALFWRSPHVHVPLILWLFRITLTPPFSYFNRKPYQFFRPIWVGE